MAKYCSKVAPRLLQGLCKVRGDWGLWIVMGVMGVMGIMGVMGVMGVMGSE